VKVGEREQWGRGTVGREKGEKEGGRRIVETGEGRRKRERYGEKGQVKSDKQSVGERREKEGGGTREEMGGGGVGISGGTGVGKRGDRKE